MLDSRWLTSGYEKQMSMFRSGKGCELMHPEKLYLLWSFPLISGLLLKLLYYQALGSPLYRAPRNLTAPGQDSNSHFLTYTLEDAQKIFLSQNCSASLKLGFLSSFTAWFPLNRLSVTLSFLSCHRVHLPCRCRLQLLPQLHRPVMCSFISAL